MPDINRRYFDSLMADKKLSLRSLAKRMEMNHSQLSLMFSGTRKAQLDEVAKLSQILGEPLYQVIEALGIDIRQPGKRIKVIGAVAGDGTVSIHPAGTVERTGAPDGLPDDIEAVQCRTPGTPLDWMDGWVFFFRHQDGIDPATLGRFSICRVKGGPAVVALVRRGYQDNTFNLSGPFTHESVALEWATPILLTRN